jgi:dTDP-D-glucose 4,6-dehydratase
MKKQDVIIITGSSGFIGSTVIRKIANQQFALAQDSICYTLPSLLGLMCSLLKKKIKIYLINLAMNIVVTL